MMEKIANKSILYVCSCMVLFALSCNSFEAEPYEWITEETVTNPGDSTAQYMNGLFYAIYDVLPNLHNRFQGSYLDASTDDGMPTKDQGGNGSLENYRNGQLSPGNIGSLDGTAWTANYMGIRRANLFLQKIDNFPNSAIGITPETRKNMKAEARALRAYYYFELLKRWGGVPIVHDQVFDVDSDLDIPRNSIDEVVDYILDEISPDRAGSCFDDLYEAYSTVGAGNTAGMYGRVNKGSVLGILSRLKLYLASPLYNETNIIAKWQEAADAAKKVIDLDVYELHPNQQDLFSMTTAFPNKELMMVKEAGLSTSIETNNSPSGYFSSTIKCWGLTSPSQNLVDAFLTLDGKMIDDPTSGYNPQDPYSNRDPRLAYTVFHNGMRWLNRDVQTFEDGLDRNNRPGFFFTKTGYYLRKFSSKSENSSTFQSLRHHNYIIRYAEILLNYAEALNEADFGGSKNEIEQSIIQIRKRAGINPGADSRYGLPATYTQEEMRKIIRNERRIELAYEEHRFWDIRRWKIANHDESVMLNPVKGVVITKQPDGSLRYEYVPVKPSTFEDKMYWYPIPRQQMQSNDKMVQNPGWNY